MNSKAVFKKIQPLCINVAKNLDIESVKKLDEFIISIIKEEKELDNYEPVSVLDDLKEYIAIPLVMIIKKQNSSSRKHSFLELVLQCLGKVLAASYIVKWDFYQDIFILLFMCITSPENPQIVDKSSEDCQMEALKNVLYLTKNLPYDQKVELCFLDFRPQLGHAVYICLKIAENEKSKELILTSLEVLLELGCKTSTCIDDVLKNMLSTTWASFLPGIAMSTTRIATRKVIQNHKITIAAIECWQYFVGLVLRDKFISLFVDDVGKSDSYIMLEKKLNLAKSPKKEKEENSSIKFKSEKKKSKYELENVIIDRKWLTSTSDRLLLLTKSILSLVSDSHWSVRNSLSCCFVECIEALITLRNDPVIEVSNAAREAMLNLRGSKFPVSELKFIELLQERLFAICTRLPNDQKILISIQQLSGFLEFLFKHIHELTQLPQHFQRFSHSLSLLFTYDYADNDILMENMNSEDSLKVMSIKPRLGRSFKYFHSDAIFNGASNCCSLIGCHGDITVIVDHCIDLIMESSLRRNEALLLLSLFLKGATKSRNKNITPQEKENIISSILDMISNFILLETPFNTRFIESNEDAGVAIVPLSSSSNTSVSVEVSKRNIILVSNTLNLISVCSLFLKKDFEVFLNRILCPVLEKAGENNLLISYSARNCLENIATSCGFESVSTLVEKSVHLFWYDLSQKLKKLPDYPSSPQVLRVVLKNHQSKDMTFIEDLVEDVLDSLDTYHHETLLPLLTVLLSYVDYFDSLCSNEVSTQMEQKPNDNKSGSLSSFMLELDKKHKEIAEELNVEESLDVRKDSDETNQAEIEFKNYNNEKSKEENSNETNFLQEEEKNIPKHIRLITQILERCSYLLFIKDRKCQLTILEIIKHSFVILKEYENQMLPCCHRIWKSLILRLKGKDYVVFCKALEVCLLMVKASRDFLRSRFLKELFPSLSSFLESQSSASLLKSKQSGYFSTPSFKAQLEVLKHIPSVLQNVQISLLNADDLIKVILLYLDNRQPIQLIRLALESLRMLKSLHPDLVWLALAFVQEPFRLTAPHPSLDNIFINGKKMNDLHQDVISLFEEEDVEKFCQQIS
ncbi:Anoctamin-10 [Armadillidium vulgare]|nr:Anoctamin-10 [Armadillidium vulgare]